MTAKTPGETPNVRVGSDGKRRGCGAKGRSGPRQGVPQQNGTSIARLSLGEFPAKLRRLTREARKYRRGLEALVPLAKKDVSDPLVQARIAHLIDAAASAEAHGSLCRWLLRDRHASMKDADVIKASEQNLKAKLLRNRETERLLDVLGLDAPPPSPWVLDVPAAEPASDSGTDLEEK
jgi:hypothetical protein